MLSIIVFGRIYSNAILHLLNPKKSLLNKCLDYIVVNKLKISKLPSELIQLIKIYRCHLRIKDTIRKKNQAFHNCITYDKNQNQSKPNVKYTHHIKFLVNQIKSLIGTQVDELILTLTSNTVKIISKFGIIEKIDDYQIHVNNLENIEELIKQLNLFFNKENINLKIARVGSSSCLWIEFSLD